jgi:hypothetical protein
MRLLLVLLEGRNELLVESGWAEGYGLSEERSKPSLEMSVLLSSNFAPFYFYCGSIRLSISISRFIIQFGSMHNHGWVGLNWE